MTIEAKFKNMSFGIGDLVVVTQVTVEEGKERFSSFEGIVISFKGREENKMFTVRRIGADNVGIEKIFPLYSPTISKITVKKKGNVRRAKLYYLRKKNAR